VKHLIYYINKNFEHDFFHIVYVIQSNKQLFNRGFLFNVGYKEILSSNYTPECILFHDVDLLPYSSGIPYNVCSHPVQLGSELEHFNWSFPYEKSCGGVISMNVRHWTSVNGFSNLYQGWGGEDDDLYVRLKRMRLLNGVNQMEIERPTPGLGGFINTERSHSLSNENHSRYSKNVKQLKKMIRGRLKNWHQDGISSTQYKILRREEITFENSHVLSFAVLHVH
jgi:N-terminal domain of galactosyltransferase/N-terminal region of glycosyl transferase group 7